MADATNVPSTTNTQAALAELANDVSLIKQVIADVKAGGIQGAIKDAPAVLAEVQKDYEAVAAALPEIKAGYKTTEFWLVVGVVAGNFIYTGFSGKPFPLEANAMIAGVVAIYSVVRGLTKQNATTTATAAVTTAAAAPAK